MIQTHHHFDHSVGLRAAVAEGLTIISRRGNEGIFREMVARPAKLFPDALGRSPKPLKFIPVDDHLKLKDSTNEIDIYHIIGNYHMADGVIVHVPASKLLVEGDLTTQEWDYNWWGDSLMNNIEYRKIKVDTNLAVHAQKPFPLAEVVSAIERQVRNTQAFCRRAAEAQFFQPGCPIQYNRPLPPASEMSGCQLEGLMRSCALSLRHSLSWPASAAAAARSTAPAGTSVTRRGPLALVGGTLIDGTGGAPVRNSVVLIRGERIERSERRCRCRCRPATRPISTEGLTVLPGLWDLHVHLMYAGHPDPRYWFDTYTPQFERVIMPASAEQMLMAGVTTVRDLAAPRQRNPRCQEAHRKRRDPGANAVCRGAGADEGGESQRRSNAECVGRGRREGEDAPADRRRRRLDQDHQRRAVDRRRDEGDCR